VVWLCPSSKMSSLHRATFTAYVSYDGVCDALVLAAHASEIRKSSGSRRRNSSHDHAITRAGSSGSCMLHEMRGMGDAVLRVVVHY
jgi:hypothetical protein